MNTTLGDSKQVLMQRALDGLSTHIAESTLTPRQKLALTCRALFDAGHDSGLAGQITARAETPGTYYTQRLGLGFDEITDENLLVVDEDLNVLEGEGMANPANRFHSWIYRARPDVQCIVHTHPFHVAALSMLEVPLRVSQMDIARSMTTAPSWLTGRVSRSAMRRARSSAPHWGQEGDPVGSPRSCDRRGQHRGVMLAGDADRAWRQTATGGHGRGNDRRPASAAGAGGP